MRRTESQRLSAREAAEPQIGFRIGAAKSNLFPINCGRIRLHVAPQSNEISANKMNPENVQSIRTLAQLNEDSL